MPRTTLATLLFAGVVTSLLIAQDEENLTSGPKVGTFLPGPFECYNVNGPAAGRQRCLVCQFGLSPAVLIFTKEQPADKDVALVELVKQFDEAAEEFKDREFSVGVVFLSPDGTDSTNNAAEEDAKKIIEETVKRTALVARLKDRAKDKLKHAVLAYYLPAGPKTYKLNAKADVTILYYERLKIQESWVFAAGGILDKDVEPIIKRVREGVTGKKKAEEKPKL